MSPSKRVLMLVENEPYPHDRRVRQEAIALRDAGYEVTVVSPNAPHVPEHDEMVDGVRAARFDRPPEGRGAVGYVREYLAAAIGMRRVLRRLKAENSRTGREFDAVIACNPPDFLIHLARPFARAGAGLIFDYHDPSPELFEAIFQRRGPIHRALLWFERRAMKTADVVMTVNEPCADLVRRRGGVPADRVHVIVTCPDPTVLFPVEPRPELRSGKHHLVLWIGRMSSKENLPLLIEAADVIVNQHGRSDVGFAIVGRGDVEEELREMIARRSLEGAVSLPGYADDAGLREWMSTADVCVSLDTPSAMNDRSLMVKVMEYMALGRPIVQFPLQEMRRVCGDATLYVEHEDAADLARTILELIDDPARADALGNAALEQCDRSGLTWQHQVPALLRAVEQAADVRAGGRERRIGRAEPARASQP